MYTCYICTKEKLTWNENFELLQCELHMRLTPSRLRSFGCIANLHKNKGKKKRTIGYQLLFK